MSNARKIVLASETRQIRVSDIPAILSCAIYPLREPSDPKSPTDSELAGALSNALAEERHRKEIIQAIRRGDFIPRSDAGTPLDAGERELFLELGYIPVDELRAYASRFEIEVIVESVRVAVQDVVDRISDATAEPHFEKWQHGKDPEIYRTIVAAMNAHGWPVDGIPGVLEFICKEIEAGRVETFSTFNGIPCADVSQVRTNPEKWYVTADGEAHIIKAISDAITRTQNEGPKRAEQYERQRLEKEAAGRFTLEEAARLIATNTDEREKATLDLLLTAVKEGKLTVHEPGRNLPYRPATVRKFYEEAYWNDLNAWLDGINFRNRWRFPPPSADGPSDAPGARPQQQSQYHDNEIMRVINELEWKPLALPRYRPGIKGAKGNIRDKLQHLTDAQFQHAWERLSKTPKRINYAE